MQTHHRIGEYFIGIIAGYLMHNISTRVLKFNRFVVSLGWIISITFMSADVYLDPKSYISQTYRNIYDSVSREAWACSICWIVFACHHLKSGGLIRTILSYRSWQPLSKMCLSIYLIHFMYITMTFSNQKEWPKFETWWQIHIHVGDIFISIALAAVFYIAIEAPTANITELVWKRKEMRIKYQNEKSLDTQPLIIN